MLLTVEPSEKLKLARLLKNLFKDLEIVNWGESINFDMILTDFNKTLIDFNRTLINFKMILMNFDRILINCNRILMGL